jgi:hypothetical protein
VALRARIGFTTSREERRKLRDRLAGGEPEEFIGRGWRATLEELGTEPEDPPPDTTADAEAWIATHGGAGVVGQAIAEWLVRNREPGEELEAACERWARGGEIPAPELVAVLVGPHVHSWLALGRGHGPPTERGAA